MEPLPSGSSPADLKPLIKHEFPHLRDEARFPLTTLVRRRARYYLFPNRGFGEWTVWPTPRPGSRGSQAVYPADWISSEENGGCAMIQELPPNAETSCHKHKGSRTVETWCGVAGWARFAFSRKAAGPQEGNTHLKMGSIATARRNLFHQTHAGPEGVETVLVVLGTSLSEHMKDHHHRPEMLSHLSIVKRSA